ncbi:MAG: lipid-A-disaccharide synthase [Candidatus Latescibacteria bacterium]|nr:lipid-A-disaccharide synthase [Candidatus Latescibacterota bacterium]
MAAEPRRAPCVLLTAGEASGDQAGAAVVAALKARHPDWRLLATGGERMAAAGAELILDYRELAVMGFAEVITRLPALRGHLNRLRRRLEDGSVDLFLPVDFPGFNLRLAARAHRAGVPVLYFVAPQLWAWGEGRVAKLRRDVDRLALILPFEEAWFRARGVEGRFVGHPLMETERPLAPAAARPRLGLLPGSRAQEVHRLLGVMLEAAARVAASLPGLELELLESPGLAPSVYDAELAGAPIAPRRCRETSAGFLARQGAALVASGTATLEAAVAGLPMVVAYRTGALNYQLARRLVRLPRIALVNVVSDAALVPELIQGDVTAEALAAAVLPLLEDGPARRAQREGLEALRASLGGAGCGAGVAALAEELLAAGPGAAP